MLSLDSFKRVVEAVDGIISETCPGGRRLRGVNSFFVTAIMMWAVWFFYLKTDSAYEQFIQMQSSLTKLVVLYDEQKNLLDLKIQNLTDRIQRDEQDIADLQQQQTGLNVQVQILKNQAVQVERHR